MKELMQILLKIWNNMIHSKKCFHSRMIKSSSQIMEKLQRLIISTYFNFFNKNKFNNMQKVEKNCKINDFLQI